MKLNFMTVKQKIGNLRHRFLIFWIDVTLIPHQFKITKRLLETINTTIFLLTFSHLLMYRISTLIANKS